MQHRAVTLIRIFLPPTAHTRITAEVCGFTGPLEDVGECLVDVGLEPPHTEDPLGVQLRGPVGVSPLGHLLPLRIHLDGESRLNLSPLGD